MTFVLTSGTPSDGEVSVRNMNIRRCRGCAGCMTDNRGRCSIDDDLTPVLEDVLSDDTLKMISDKDGHWFAMPMRKAVERLGNILEAWTSSGNNIPECDDAIALRNIIVVVEGPEDAEFEQSAREVLEKGPVSVCFEYE